MRLSIRAASVFNPLKLSRAAHKARSGKPTIPLFPSALVRSTANHQSTDFPPFPPPFLLFFPFFSFEFPGFPLKSDRPRMQIRFLAVVTSHRFHPFFFSLFFLFPPSPFYLSQVREICQAPRLRTPLPSILERERDDRILEEGLLEESNDDLYSKIRRRFFRNSLIKEWGSRCEIATREERPASAPTQKFANSISRFREAPHISPSSSGASAERVKPVKRVKELFVF